MARRAARKPSYATLKRKLDKVFSEWFRRRWADPNGIVACVTCGNNMHWKNIQCGHFVSRSYLGTRWEPENCAPQCYACNYLRRGNYAEFAKWIIGRYGQSILDDLIALKHRPVKFSRADLQAKIYSYGSDLTR